MVTESEERRIDEIYKNRVKLCASFENKVANYQIKKVLFAVGFLLLLIVLVPMTFGGILILLWYYNRKQKRKERDGLESNKEKIEKKFDDEFGYTGEAKKGYYKRLWEKEANFTIAHLKYLAMKSWIEESKFKNFLHCPGTNFQLNERDINDKFSETLERGLQISEYLTNAK